MLYFTNDFLNHRYELNKYIDASFHVHNYSTNFDRIMLVFTNLIEVNFYPTVDHSSNSE